MKKVTFITGNQNKADQLSAYLGFPIDHVKLDLDELQSMDLGEIVEHKVRQAHEKTGGAVIVEDAALGFDALGGLPGPFIKFFVDNIPLEDICSMLDGKTRTAIAKSVFGYFDGVDLKIFDGSGLIGKIAEEPSGDNGYDWDKIFIPDGYDVTRSNLSEEDYYKTYLEIKPLASLKEYFDSKK